jgi:hypothetical protein
MKPNLCVPTIKHTDLDYFGSFGAPTQPPVFPTEYDTDAGLGMPDQAVEGEPNGCTNYAQADLSTDLTSIPKRPADLEAITHANARGGYNIRDSLDAARKLGWFNWYFNIQAYAPLDWFDAIRYAQLMGVANNEKRSVTIGTPWFPSWEVAAIKGQHILPMPTPEEIQNIVHNPSSYGWHNWDSKGWKSLNGVLVLSCKSWQGKRVGDEGWLYVPREVINVIMSLESTVAYTPTMLDAPVNVRIALPIFKFIMSFNRNFSLSLN